MMKTTTTLVVAGLLVFSCPCLFDPRYRRQRTVVDDNNHPQRLRLANVHMQTK
jgi:hypothetical protein